MQIKLASVTVEIRKTRFDSTRGSWVHEEADISMGTYRWLTVSSRTGLKAWSFCWRLRRFHLRASTRSPYDAGIPSTASYHDIASEFKRLKDVGVAFRSEPQKWTVIAAVFGDTCAISSTWCSLRLIEVRPMACIRTTGRRIVQRASGRT